MFDALPVGKSACARAHCSAACCIIIHMRVGKYGRPIVARTYRKRSSSATKHFQRNSHIFFYLRWIGELVLDANNDCRSELSNNRQTDTHTQNDYSNPRCACAPRVNYILYFTILLWNRWCYPDYGCKKSCSVRTGSFFEKSKLTLQ